MVQHVAQQLPLLTLAQRLAALVGAHPALALPCHALDLLQPLLCCQLVPPEQQRDLLLAWINQKLLRRLQ